MYKGTFILAEVKPASPFGFRSKKTWDELFQIAVNIGDGLSIHTDSLWEGSFDLVKKARSLTNKFILAKGIHENNEMIDRAIQSGAQRALVVGRIPDYPDKYLFIEPNNLEQLKTIPEHFAVVWNQRDLKTGKKKQETFAQARECFKGFLIQASFISSVADIAEDADAIIVGEHLEEFAQSIINNEGWS